MRRLVVLLFSFLVSACLTQALNAKPNVLVVVHGSQTLPAALKTFEDKYGKDACTFEIQREDGVVPVRLAQANVVFIQHPTSEFMARMKQAGVEAVKRGMKVVTDVPETLSREWGMEPAMPLTTLIMPYWNNGGEQNMLAVLVHLYKAAGGDLATPVPPLEQLPRMGVYHPDAPRTSANLDDYLKWYRKAKPHQGALVTINFYHSFLKDRNMSLVDAVIRALERQGLAAAGVFGMPHGVLKPIFNQPASDPVRVMLMMTLSMVVRPEDRAFLEEQNVHLINLLFTGQTRAEWEASDTGVSPARINGMLVMPEMSGATEPTQVATTEKDPQNGVSIYVPIEERVEAAAMRARRWVSLIEKKNAGKKLAILYFNNPPGKGNIGASYLNVPPSIQAVLQTLHEAGYQTGESVPTTDEILAMIDKAGRNIENWAPGELDVMARSGKVTLLPLREYEKWFRATPRQFQEAVVARWGKPSDATLMAWTNPQGEKFFVIPGMTLGNIFLGPQLLRASFAEYTSTQHSSTLPPHHGYIASYLWYRHAFGADAMIHMGRHGTLEWLPGKNAGQAGWDTSEVLLGDLPNVNYYIMDGGGEAMQARRRAAAVLISHLTPILTRTGPEPRFQPLADLLEQWKLTRETSPALGREYENKALAESERVGLIKQLSLDVSRPVEALEKIEEFLDSVDQAPIPLGLPTLGAMPSEDRQRAGLLAYLDNAFLADERKLVKPFLQSWTDAIFDGKLPEPPSSLPPAAREKCVRSIQDANDWLRDLQASPARELGELVRVLRGEFLPSGPVGDPLGVPGTLPSGRNLHQGDPALLPTRAAWELGKRMGEQMLAAYKREHDGQYPDHISMVLWQGESSRAQGASEAEAMYLMGVEPEWNARGQVDRLKLIPDDQLTHPRINVLFTASGLYRDGMSEKILMLDRAARLAASAGDNALSRQNKEVEQKLVAHGMAAEQARELAGARVFSTAPGAYGTGLSSMVEQSRDKDQPGTMAELYMSKMNYVYSEKNWGSTVPKLFESQLKSNQMILHSRSSNLYGAVDNDDVYQWMGGLRIASAAVGAKPELMINDLRRAGQEKVKTAKEFIAADLNSRNWNPQWIAEMQKEGYSGAREMMKTAENLYGWQATAPETVAPEVWQKMYDVYVADEYSLGLQKFMEQANPAARQALLGRLIEIDRQGVYKFTAEQKQQMLREFLRNVAEHGVACSANICGNRKLAKSIAEQARALTGQQISPEDLKNFEQIYNKATSKPKPSASTPMANASRPGLPTTLGRFKVTYVKIEELAQTYQRFAREHARAILAGCFLWLLTGVCFGLARRRWSRFSMIQLMGDK